MAAYIFSRFPVRSPREAARCKLPFALRPGSVPRKNRYAPKKETKRKRKKSVTVPYSRADAMNGGVGKNSGGSFPAPASSSAPSASASALLSCSCSILSRSSHSDASLPASSSTAGTIFPTSVEVRKSSTTRLHLSSAKRSRILHRLFHRPVSFLTSA